MASSISSYTALARISKMPVLNNSSKFYAHPDLATNLLQILIPVILNSLLCQKGQFTLQPTLEDGLLEKYLVMTKSQN